MAEFHPVPLTVQRIDFETSFLESGRVSSNWGPTLRGGFGYALRGVSCALGADSCKECMLGASCAYGYLFETPITHAGGIMQKYPQAPHPFVFEPSPEGPDRVKEGDRASHGFVVVGEAIRYLPHVFLAIERLGREGLGRDRAAFQIERVSVRGGPTLYDRSQGHCFQRAGLIALDVRPGPSAPGRFHLNFQTATRIVVDGRLVACPTLKDLVKTLCRRVFLLRHFHCGGDGQPVASEFIDAARAARCTTRQFAWNDAQRFSTRQERAVPIGGFVGRMTCEGDLGLLRPLLLAGQYVHVGKNATFGLGKFVLAEGDDA